MSKVIIVQGKTVEEATTQALAALGITHEEAEIEVLVNPSRRLMGLRRVMAEVKVTKLEKTSALTEEMAFEEAIDAIFEGESMTSTQVKEDKGVRVHKGALEFLIEGESYPTIETSEGVLFRVNGETKCGKVIVQPDDQVTIEVSNEVIPPQFSIQLLEQDMIGLLTFTPGKAIVRTIADTPFSSYLKVIPKEEVTYFNDLDPQQIVEELKRVGVQQGIIFPAIKKVTTVEKPYELIVARGTSPIEGSDGDLEVHIELDEFDPDSLARIDFREMNKISSSKEGDIIATHIPPVEGKVGRNLRGQSIPVNPVRDINLRLGKNVERIDEQVIAKIAGNPSVTWRDRMVKIEVNPEFHHPGEVSLESGNIRSEGDVRIGGNVLSSMFVGATGSIHIGGAVTQATVQAMGSVVIYGNVLSSTVTVGQQEVIMNDLVDELGRLTTVLKKIKVAMEQIFVIRGTTADDLTSSELKQLIYLLLEKKYSNFEALNKSFIQAVKENEGELTEEWKVIAEQLHAIFVAPVHEDMKLMDHLYAVIEEAKTLVETYRFDVSSKEQLIVPYAVNSTLYSNGDIQVVSKGVFQSKLTAENNITVKGVCRGGEVVAKNQIILDETGSESPVKTLIRTNESGRIKIGKAYAGTEIQIGNRRYSFMRDGYNIHARLNEEGELVL